MQIAVIGGNSALPDACATAEEVGREIARGGHVLVCGGRSGVMEAACRGAREAAGHTIGILPGPDAAGANKFVEFKVLTNMGFARNVIVVLSASAVIAIDGSYGTLSEIAMALNHGRPVIGLGTWRISDDAGIEDAAVIRAVTPAEAVELAVAASAHAARSPQGASAR
jgi:uncharacterized protein (TIGR00725 family)